MRDRLVELKEHLLQKSSQHSSSQDNQNDTEEEDTSPRRGSIVVYMDRRNTLTAVEDSFMVEFFQEVEDTREKIECMEKHTDEIRKLHSKILLSPRTEPSIQMELDDRMASIKSISTGVRKTLQMSHEPTEDELEDIMEKGDVNIFTDNVILKTQEARQALADVEARHEEILRIEKSIRELRDMFLEMAILVESQVRLRVSDESKGMNKGSFA
ncbi:syntaxin-1A-like [Hetaerina americana]|uniref:syntaxin-1A-like n=1 Tax=Hetaerina americana TaxID=62018 RepID=UPI003A7F0F75